MIEYRVCWSAGSNITFHGKSEWSEWGGFEETVEEVEAALYKSHGQMSASMEEALEASGFECWPEVRRLGPESAS
jgi:hypothetical protein